MSAVVPVIKMTLIHIDFNNKSRLMKIIFCHYVTCFISVEIIYVCTCLIWVIFDKMANPVLNMFKEVSWLIHINNSSVS